MYDGLGLLPISADRLREAAGLPPLTPRNIVAIATDAIDRPWAQAASDALRAGGGAREATVAAVRTTRTGQDVEAEWRRQKAAELVETVKRAAPWIVGGYIVLRALR